MESYDTILCDLIRIRTDTESDPKTDPLVDYITDILQKNNIVFTSIPTPNNLKKNILACINVNSLHDINDGIILSGHMDTVGASLSEWKSDPFIPERKGNDIYGRGTVDMKQFIAIVLALLPQLKQFQIPIFFSFTCDEETDDLGIQQIIKYFKEHNIQPRYALVGEATNFNLYVGHRGYIGFQTIIDGVSGHAGSPERGTNAVYIGAKFISKIESLNQIYASQGTTLNVGIASGGIERNSIPARSIIDWELRCCCQDHQTAIIDEINRFIEELRSQYPNGKITIEKKETLYVFEEKSDSPLTAKAEQILGTKRMHCSFASEAGFFQTQGIDTLICGPGFPELAHSSSEHISIQDLDKYAKFLIDLIKQL